MGGAGRRGRRARRPPCPRSAQAPACVATPRSAQAPACVAANSKAPALHGLQSRNAVSIIKEHQVTVLIFTGRDFSPGITERAKLELFLIHATQNTACAGRRGAVQAGACAEREVATQAGACAERGGGDAGWSLRRAGGGDAGRSLRRAGGWRCRPEPAPSGACVALPRLCEERSDVAIQSTWYGIPDCHRSPQRRKGGDAGRSLRRAGNHPVLRTPLHRRGISTLHSFWCNFSEIIRLNFHLFLCSS
jgi:hypothetical protein